MDIIFADDARQPSPTRKGMRPIIAIGGVHVSADKVSDLEKAIDQLCRECGFPKGEQFKWSPDRKDWMYKNLLGTDRLEFYTELFNISLRNEAKSLVVVSDMKTSFAISSSSDHFQDVTSLFLERANWSFEKERKKGIVIIAKPGGGSGDEEKFVLDCIDTLEKGTNYVTFDRIPLSVMTANNKHIRLLQLADVITSCTLSRIAGEPKYSPEVFDLIKPIYRKASNLIGGAGLKIHPDFRYLNLYYWLLGDKYVKKGNTGFPLPTKHALYYENPGE
ncbi:MAG: DUF3800 domain-containing protein [Candidatus Dadabacteria bacterium]|nr:DUF3800 domain-containing protein [Candidatus Dadabacteria bacterium]